MSKKTKKEISLIILYSVIAIGLVVAFQASLLVGFLFSNAWFVLVFVILLMLIGAVYGIFKLLIRTKLLDSEIGKEITVKTLIWIIVAIVSGAGALLSLFFGFQELIDLRSFLSIVMINLLAAFLTPLFILSIMKLISDVKRRKEVL